MRPRWSGLTCFFAFVSCFQLALAAPAETVTSLFPSFTSHGSSYTQTTLRPSELRSAPHAPDHDDDDDSHTSTAVSHTPSTSHTSSHSLAIPTPHSRSHNTFWSNSITRTGTHPFPPHALPTAPTGNAPSSSTHGQSAVAIVFEVLGGVLALLILLAFARCWYSYRRTPSRDRIGALLNRHQLEREMEEQQRDRMERISRAMEAYRWHPPPPPYQHAPAYDTVAGADSVDGSVDWGRPSFPSASHPRSPTP